MIDIGDIPSAIMDLIDEYWAYWWVFAIGMVGVAVYLLFQ